MVELKPQILPRQNRKSRCLAKKHQILVQLLKEEQKGRKEDQRKHQSLALSTTLIPVFEKERLDKKDLATLCCQLK